MIALLLFLFAKIWYLKYRRIQTIHDVPASLSKIPSVRDEERDVTGSDNSVAQSRKHSSWLPTSQELKRSSAPGILVGCLGSPEWETNMVRTVADHQWRQRRASNVVANNWKFRHTWHSNPASMRDTRTQRSNSLRIVPHTDRRDAPRMAHVSSFGEIQSATARMRRQQSLSAVVEGLGLDLSGSHASPYGSNASPVYYTANSHTSALPSPQYAFGNRPSTIREEITANSSGLQMSAPRILLDCPSDDSLQSVGSLLPQPVFQPQDTQNSVIEPSMTFATMNGSVDSSVVSSFGQLPSFPSPPLSTPRNPHTSFVGAVVVSPVYFTDGVMDIPRDESIWKKELGRVKDLEAMLFDLRNVTESIEKPSRASFTDDSDLFFRLESPPVMNLSPQATEKAPVKSLGDGRIDFANALIETTRNGEFDRIPFGPIANLEHREHARVRSQVPFSLVLPPKAYLGSAPRSDQLSNSLHLASSLRRSSSDFESIRRDGGMHLMPSYPSSTNQPYRPSPLRKAISLSTISSRFSAGSTLDKTLLSIEQELGSMTLDAPLGHFGGSMDMNTTSSAGRSEMCNNDSQKKPPGGDMEPETEQRSSECCATTEEEYVSEFYSFSSAGTVEADVRRGAQSHLLDVMSSDGYSCARLFHGCHGRSRCKRVISKY